MAVDVTMAVAMSHNNKTSKLCGGMHACIVELTRLHTNVYSTNLRHSAHTRTVGGALAIPWHFKIVSTNTHTQMRTLS